MIHPSARIVPVPGPTVQVVPPQAVCFECRKDPAALRFPAARQFVFAAMPFNFIQTVPPAQILTSDGETLTSDGEALTW